MKLFTLIGIGSLMGLLGCAPSAGPQRSSGRYALAVWLNHPQLGEYAGLGLPRSTMSLTDPPRRVGVAELGEKGPGAMYFYAIRRQGVFESLNDVPGGRPLAHRSPPPA